MTECRLVQPSLLPECGGVAAPPRVPATEDAVSSLGQLAMASLIRGNELELAVCVGTALGEAAAPATHCALELLARKCMMIPVW